MNDKELIEFAAKAHGNCKYFNDAWRCAETGYREFNPLSDDGDALRLMVKLNLDVNVGTKFTRVLSKPLDTGVKAMIDNRLSKLESTRLAITIAAAKIGKSNC